MKKGYLFFAFVLHILNSIQAQNTITNSEYWFDNDYANKVTAGISPVADYTLNSNVNTSGLTIGVHSIHIRFKDANALWSSVLTQTFFKSPVISQPNKIDKYRYWFDTASASMITSYLPTPMEDYNLVTNIDCSMLPFGQHQIHFQFNDINGLWSSVTNDTFSVSQNIPVASFSGMPLNLSEGQYVTYTNQSQFANTYQWYFQGGTPTTSTLQNPTVQYNTSGNYDVTLVVANGFGFDTLKRSTYVHVVPYNGNGINGISGINFGNVLAGSFADHLYYFTNNTPNAITISGFQFSPTGVFTVLSPNGLTIPPHNQLPVSFFFYPNAIQNYSGSVAVSSDAPNSSFVIQLLGNGVAQNASKIRVFNKLDNNPTLSNESDIASNFITATTVNTVKVCADGSNATRVSFTNNASTIQTTNIRFRMKSDPFGSNTDYSGWFINSDYSINGNTVTAKFTHPKYLNINGLYRVDTLQVIDNATSNVVYEHPFRIYRAPVLMVHGLWGNQLSLLDLQYSLVTSGKYNGNLVYLVDYEITNASPFSYNNNVIWTSINSEFSLLRLLGYSAGKVDIVAHSMGGIISRIYLQRPICGSSPCYRNDIHKLITLNTPHSGTQVANYILSSNPCATNVAQNILDLSGMYWNNGAVADLRCNSQAISDINTAPNLNRNVVPCHSIITNTSPTVSTGTDENTLTNAIATCRGETGTVFNNILYAFTPNDLVVPTESQKGGLNDFSYYNSVMHTASPSDIQVMNKVALLLDENTNTSVYFDQNTGGYNPPVIQPTFKYDPLEEDPNNSTQSGQVTITSPTSGFVTSPGATIQIVISSTGGTKKLLSLIQNKNINNFALDTAVGNITFNYTIPLNATGNIRIFAAGFDNTGYTGFDTADIVSMPTASLDSIRFVEDYISVPKQQNQSFTIRAFYNNGAVIDITKIQGLSYQLLNNALATVTSNYVTGVDTGFTVLSATYQGKSSQTYLKVYLGDNWVTTGIDLTTANQFNSSLLVYPNPASDVINIAFNSNSQMKAKVRISDNYGRIVKELDIFKCKQGINQKEILISNLSAGLYFCEVELDREKFVKKFIVTR